MAAQVGRYAAQKMLRKQMKNYYGKNVETGDVSLYFLQSTHTEL